MGRSDARFVAGDFDVYLLAQTWAPHFCCQNTDRCNTVPWAFSAKHLSLHGLWPGFSKPREGQTFPEKCEAAKKLLPNFLPREYIDVAPSFTTYDAALRQATVGGLAKHEWSKHGTCTGLAPDQYFAEALRAFELLPGNRGTPSILSENVGGAVGAPALRAAYAKRIVRRDRTRSCALRRTRREGAGVDGSSLARAGGARRQAVPADRGHLVLVEAARRAHRVSGRLP
jgi:ribonuclease I